MKTKRVPALILCVGLTNSLHLLNTLRKAVRLYGRRLEIGKELFFFRSMFTTVQRTDKNVSNKKKTEQEKDKIPRYFIQRCGDYKPVIKLYFLAQR